MEIFLTFVVRSCDSVENDSEIRHKLKKYSKGSCCLLDICHQNSLGRFRYKWVIIGIVNILNRQVDY